MFHRTVPEAAIFSATDRRRHIITVDDALRTRVLDTTHAVRTLLQNSLLCGYLCQIRALVAQTVRVAAPWSAGLDDPGNVAAVAAQVRASLEADIAAGRAQFLELMDPAELTADPSAVRPRRPSPACRPSSRPRLSTPAAHWRCWAEIRARKARSSSRPDR
jgi:hypothetical protein